MVHLRAAVALISLVSLSGCSGCDGGLNVGEPRPDAAQTSGGADGGESSSSDASSPDVGVRADADADAGEEEPPRIPNPNTLDQDRLFTCDPATVSSSPERIRRLTPAQYDVRFVPRTGTTPYGSDERFRYTSDASDARMDDASAEQLLLYGFWLGQAAADRRIGWGYCMRESTYEPQGRDRPTQECLEEWAAAYLLRAWQREATPEEVAWLVDYANASIDEYGDEKGLALTASRPYLAPEFLFKDELAAGELDADGRARMGSWEIARAIAAAITDMALVRFYHTREVDEHLLEVLDALREAAQAGELETREQVEQHVRALLSVPLPVEGDPQYPILPTNIARFFHEYLGHPGAAFVFKNGGALPREAPYIYYSGSALPVSMDQTIAYLYQEDRQLLNRLLSTRDFFVVLGRDEHGFAYNLADGDRATPENITPGMTSFPPEERAGVLTHPAWLAAHSRNQFDEPHPVHRGKWIFENMLCGTIPELPITVDAQLPDRPSAGVRERLESVTGPQAENGYCWSCHRLMDPLGIPFESYDHYGRYRAEEKVGDGSFVPVDPATTLVMTGDPELDGKEVSSATELAELLADSERVEGCFVRNTFRYFMGRAETYEDACTLVAMRDAYRESDGSFKEMLVTLLTSDTFLYRHPAEDPESNDGVQP